MVEQHIVDFQNSLKLHIKYVQQACLIVGGIPDDQIDAHDQSKYCPDEFEPYARWFHSDDKRPDEFSRAWLHHIHWNPHHWQHWIFPDGFALKGSKSENGILPIPENYAREMVADWMGASIAYTQSWDMSGWLNNHLANGKIKLHSDTRNLVDEILISMGYSIITNDQDDIHYHLGDWSKYPVTNA